MGIGRSSGNLRAPDKFRRFSGVGACFHISSRHQDFVNRNSGRGIHGYVTEQRATVHGSRCGQGVWHGGPSAGG